MYETLIATFVESRNEPDYDPLGGLIDSTNRSQPPGRLNLCLNALHMPLFPDEIALFRQRVQEDDPYIYEGKYDIDDLLLRTLVKQLEVSL